MGGTGIATLDPTSLNRINPASWGDLQITTVELGGFYRATNAATNTDAANARTGNLVGLALGFKGAKGPAMGFGIAPLTAVGFNVRELLTSYDSLTIQNISQGDGGLNEFYVGTGKSFLRNRLNLGVNVGLVFGGRSIEYLSAFSTVTEPESLESIEGITSEDRIRGFTYKLGFQYTDTLGRGLLGRIGAYVGGGNTLQIDSKTFFQAFVGYTSLTFADSAEADTFNNIITYSREGIFADTTFVLEELSNKKLQMPLEIGVGLGIHKLGKYSIQADFVYQGWSAYERNEKNGGFQDAYRVSLGGEWIPANSSPSLFKRLAYRAGVRAEKTFLAIRGQEIYDYGVTLGFGIPLARSFSQVHIAVEYGKRGTKTNGLVLESYFQIGLGMSFTERWFVRRRFD